MTSGRVDELFEWTWVKCLSSCLQVKAANPTFACSTRCRDAILRVSMRLPVKATNPTFACSTHCRDAILRVSMRLHAILRSPCDSSRLPIKCLSSCPTILLQIYKKNTYLYKFVKRISKIVENYSTQAVSFRIPTPVTACISKSPWQGVVAVSCPLTVKGISAISHIGRYVEVS